MTTPCSQTSLDAKEPLAGTACAQTVHWIGLEYARPWRPKGVLDTELPAPVAQWLKEQASTPQTRPLLLRQRGRRGRALIYANLNAGKVHRFELDRYRDLLDLPWSALREGTTDLGRTPEQPIFVCTHSARDHCCGLHGAGVARALCALAPSRVWQCSHLGGHRFAATLVALPHGIHFGRLRAEHAEPLLAALDGERLFDLDHVRGTVRLSPQAQAAELHLRRRLGLHGLHEVQITSCTPRGEEHEVIATCNAGSYRFAVRRIELGPSAPPSCGAEPAAVRSYQVQDLE